MRWCVCQQITPFEYFCVCVLDWIEVVIFDMATNIETSFSSLVHEIVLKPLELTESSCFWIVTSFCVLFKCYYKPFPCKWDVHIWSGQLYLLLRYKSLKFESLASKNQFCYGNRTWQNSLRCNWMMPHLTWLIAFLGGIGPILLPDLLPFHCTE